MSRKLILLVLSLSVCQLCFSQQASKMFLGDKIDLSIFITLPAHSFTISDTGFYSVIMPLRITNNSRNAVDIFKPINILNDSSILKSAINDAFITYNVQQYDTADSAYHQLYGNVVVQDAAMQAQHTTVNVKQAERYVQEIKLFQNLNLRKPGKYRLQLIVGTRVNSFYSKFPSNTVEFELRP